MHGRMGERENRMKPTRKPAPSDPAAASVPNVPNVAKAVAPSSALHAANTSSAPADPRVGSRWGKYLLVERLGHGGMGVVYKAQDEVLQRVVAIKVMVEAPTEPDLRRRFAREAKAAARISHPNTVTMFEIGEHDGLMFLAMEYVQGGTAQDRLTARGTLPWRESVRILAGACRGLIAAHAAGLIHRDIKPANILVSLDGHSKLTDFGLVRITDNTTLTPISIEGNVVGTPHFMSPEQCRGDELDGRSDIYSMGATLFTLLTGRHPYEFDQYMTVMFAHCENPVPDPREFAPSVPEPCAKIVMRAMAKDPNERFATARELSAALESLLKQRRRKGSTETRPVPPSQTSPSRAAELADTQRLTVELGSSATNARWSERAYYALWAGVAALVFLFAALFGTFAGRWLKNTPTDTSNTDIWTETPPSTLEAAPIHRALRNLIANRKQRAGDTAATATALDNNEKEIANLRQWHELLKQLEPPRRITKPVQKLDAQFQVDGLVYMPIGKLIISVRNNGENGRFEIHAWKDGKRVTEQSYRGSARTLLLLPDGKTLLVATQQFPLMLWQPGLGKVGEIAAPKGLDAQVTAVALNPRTQCLAIACRVYGKEPPFYRILVWDIEKKIVRRDIAAGATSIEALIFSSDGACVYSGGNGREIRSWDVATGQALAPFPTAVKIVKVMAINESGDTLAIGGHNHRDNQPMHIELRHAKTGVGWADLHGHAAALCDLKFAPGSKFLVSCGYDHTARVWEMSTAREIATIEVCNYLAYRLDFMSDGGALLVTGDWVKQIQVWDLAFLVASGPARK